GFIRAAHRLPASSSCKDSATSEIYALSLHDALPICAEREGARAAVRGADQDEARQLRGARRGRVGCQRQAVELPRGEPVGREDEDRKSTRLNSSHVKISYAVFCLKKKKKGKLESHNM